MRTLFVLLMVTLFVTIAQAGVIPLTNGGFEDITKAYGVTARGAAFPGTAGGWIVVDTPVPQGLYGGTDSANLSPQEGDKAAYARLTVKYKTSGSTYGSSYASGGIAQTTNTAAVAGETYTFNMYMGWDDVWAAPAPSRN